MTQSEIVTQHFNDPIGSVMNINGKCYVKVSNKTHTIDTPVPTDEYSVYFENTDDCENNRVRKGKLLCPPVGKLLFTVAEVDALAVISFDIAPISIPPTNMIYNDKPISMSRTMATTTFYHPTIYNHPTKDTDGDGNQRVKASLSRVMARTFIQHGTMTSTSVINKLLHK